jgi:hypothetical protein
VEGRPHKRCHLRLLVQRDHDRRPVELCLRKVSSVGLSLDPVRLPPITVTCLARTFSITSAVVARFQACSASILHYVSVVPRVGPLRLFLLVTELVFVDAPLC